MACQHNADYECAACTDARHRAVHPVTVDGCLACKLETIQLSQAWFPSKPGGAPPAGNRNAWERGIATDHRGVALLDGSGEPIGVKRYAENRTAFEAERRRLANDPVPFPAKA